MVTFLTFWGTVCRDAARRAGLSATAELLVKGLFGLTLEHMLKFQLHVNVQVVYFYLKTQHFIRQQSQHNLTLFTLCHYSNALKIFQSHNVISHICVTFHQHV